MTEARTETGTETETLTLAGGLLTVEAPLGSEIEERGPGYELVLLPGGGDVHVCAEAIRGDDGLFAPDTAVAHTVGKQGKSVTPTGDFFRDVQTVSTPPGPDGRRGRVFARFGRHGGETLRAVTFGAGRFDDDSDADRARADEAARALAASARFADRETPLDEVAPDAGEALVQIAGALLFCLPPGWTGKQIVSDRSSPDEDDGVGRFEMRFRSADKRFEIDVYLGVDDSEPEFAADPIGTGIECVRAACEDLNEQGEFGPNIVIATFPDTPHVSGVIRTDPYDAKRHELFRAHAFVGPRNFIYTEFLVRGPKRRSRLEDAATLEEIDAYLSHAQAWHPRLADVLVASSGRHERREPEDAGVTAGAGAGAVARDENSEDWVSLGLGMVRLPLLAGWSWSADPPFGGRFTSTDGLRLDVSVKSMFDPGALSDRSRLAAYADEDGYDRGLPDGADVLANIMILAPGNYEADGTPPDRPIVLKSLERQGETNIRILRIEIPLPPDTDPTVDLDAALEGALKAGTEMLLRADWAQAATPFDRIAPSAEAKLVGLRRWFWFQLPADWTFTSEDSENANADDADGIESVWIDAALFSNPDDTLDRAALEEFPTGFANDGWLDGQFDFSREWHGDRDLLDIRIGEDKDESGPLRRILYMRIVAMAGHLAVLQFNHVVDRDKNDERRAWTGRFIKEALASAVVLPELR